MYVSFHLRMGVKYFFYFFRCLFRRHQLDPYFRFRADFWLCSGGTPFGRDRAKIPASKKQWTESAGRCCLVPGLPTLVCHVTHCGAKPDPKRMLSALLVDTFQHTPCVRPLLRHCSHHVLHCLLLGFRHIHRGMCYISTPHTRTVL